MARFIEANGLYINVDFVKQYWRTKSEKLCIELSNGGTVSVSPSHADYVQAELEGRYYVVELVPVQEPVYAVYDKETGGYFAGRIHYIALCADGYIRGVENFGGGFDLLSDGDCAGVFHRNQLGQFSNIEIEEAEKGDNP